MITSRRRTVDTVTSTLWRLTACSSRHLLFDIETRPPVVELLVRNGCMVGVERCVVFGILQPCSSENFRIAECPELYHFSLKSDILDMTLWTINIFLQNSMGFRTKTISQAILWHFALKLGLAIASGRRHSSRDKFAYKSGISAWFTAQCTSPYGVSWISSRLLLSKATPAKCLLSDICLFTAFVI